jgi:U3 small nucleolar RNA-associated protein MPP10
MDGREGGIGRRRRQDFHHVGGEAQISPQSTKSCKSSVNVGARRTLLARLPPSMAPLSFSPTGSISSHTLSAQSAQAAPIEPNQHSSQALVAALSASPHSFLQPTPSLHAASLVFAKQFLDPLAAGISDAQIARRNEARKKRKRGEKDVGESSVLGLKKVHLQGFGIDQVWEQAKRVLDAAREEVERTLPKVQEAAASNETNGAGIDMMRFDEDGFEIGSSEDEEDEEMEELGSEEDSDPEIDPNAEEDEDFDHDDFEEGFHTDEEDEGLEGSEDEQDLESQEGGELVEDPHGLNDGFFSIDDFNRQSQFLERQDERGEDDGAASDEEEVNWAADPLSVKPSDGHAKSKDDEEEDSDEEEDGPTFGNADLNAPMSDSEEDEVEADNMEEDGLGLAEMANTNNIMYADFFAPPARKTNKKGRPHPHNFPKKGASNKAKLPEPAEDNIERTMDAVHRDLFSDSDPNDSEDSLSDVDAADPKSRRSNHERRQAKIADEIRRLEAANVAKRQWTMSGEAQAADRPLNSLLEEDLDFERTGKPVPVITTEVSEDIEALIKRRILAKDFDEVIRRRPDDLATGQQGVRRGRFELETTKPEQGLAEEYEEEHLRRTDPNYVDQRDEKLRKEHAEIDKLWKDVSSKLDALCSWNYRPKPASTSLDIRTDAPAITMEDARPSAGGDMGSASMLAPQEVYKPGEEKSKEEIHTKAGLPVARDELTREQKLRRRRREKERIRKAGGNPGAKNESQASRDKKQLAADLKKGGVKRIGKTGEILDSEGNAIKEGRKMTTGQSFKL